jgi:hypothetical protein
MKYEFIDGLYSLENYVPTVFVNLIINSRT